MPRTLVRARFTNGGNNGISINSCQRINIDNTNFVNQNTNGILVQTGTNINIDNCNLQGGGLSTNNGIIFNNVQYSIISNTNIANYGNGSPSNNYGIYLTSFSSNNLIEKVNVNNITPGVNPNGAIQIDNNSTNNTIYSCFLSETNFIAIYLFSNSNIIKNCTISYNSGEGMLVNTSSYNIIKDCIIEFNGDNGISLQNGATDNVIENNVVNNNNQVSGSEGISLASNNNLINNNIASFNLQRGIFNSGNNSFLGNIAQQNTNANYFGVPSTIIAVYSISAGEYLSTPTICCNENLSIVN